MNAIQVTPDSTQQKRPVKKVTLRIDATRILYEVMARVSSRELVHVWQYRRVDAHDADYLLKVLFELLPWPEDPKDARRVEWALLAVEERAPEVGAFLRARFEQRRPILHA